ncbi:hypothetical protein CUR178_03811 [Leishmania enriettii]|uniref:Thioredoxin domain-containing protein n=1 Tax=Leishmania enriettii TaxID=5663 RepID=A0A836HH45_LEIEN|nr:hypothetical protein CUR178_03811 [Leishmania enriettii]
MSLKTRTFASRALLFVATLVVTSLVAITLLEAKRVFHGDRPSRVMEGIVDISSENYYDVVGNDQFVLLEFYSDGCSFCRDFASVYEELGKYALIRPELQEKLVVGKVDSPSETRIQRRYKIKGYPTVVLVPPNRHAGVHFTGKRDFNELLAFVQREMEKKEYAIAD